MKLAVSAVAMIASVLLTPQSASACFLGFINCSKDWVEIHPSKLGTGEKDPKDEKDPKEPSASSIREGYLRVYVTSNTAGFPTKLHSDFKLLYVGLQATYQGQTFELPIFDYDTETQVRREYLSAEIGKLTRVDAQGNDKVTMKVIVRSIKKSGAELFQNAAAMLQEMAQGTLGGSLSAATPALSAATRIFDGVSKAAGSSTPWETTASIDISTRPSALLQLNGPPLAVFFTSRERLEQRDEVKSATLCNSVDGLCENNQSFVKVPYILIKAELLPHRSINDYTKTSVDLSCAPSQGAADAYSDVIRLAPLTQSQRRVEELLQRAVVLTTKSADGSISRHDVGPIAQSAWSLKAAVEQLKADNNSDDLQTWQAGGYQRNFDSLLRCVEANMLAQAALGTAWISWRSALNTAFSWRQGKHDLENLEKNLHEISKPIIADKLDISNAGKTFEALDKERNAIEGILEQEYKVRSAQVASQVATSPTTGDVDTLLKLWIDYQSTSCSRCLPHINQAIQLLTDLKAKNTDPVRTREALQYAQQTERVQRLEKMAKAMAEYEALRTSMLRVPQNDGGDGFVSLFQALSAKVPLSTIQAWERSYSEAASVRRNPSSTDDSIKAALVSIQKTNEDLQSARSSP